MRHLLTILLFCLSQLSLSAQTRYVDLLHFDLIGKATTHTLTPYDRLPDTLQHRIRKPLWDLSRNTAGLSVRFRSNSTAISLKWENLNGFHMDHMTDIGVRGFDLYARQSDGTWHFAGVARVRSGKEGNSTIVKNMTPEWREYMLFLPLYDGVVKAAIGIDSTASIEKALVNDPITRQPIVFYGTSIMQGGCASRPGMAYTNILQRRLHRACVNLGFSGNGLLDLDVARVMASVDASAFVLDFVPNATVKQMRDSMMTFYQIIRDAHPTTPILFVHDPIFSTTSYNQSLRKEVTEKNETVDSIFAIIRRRDHHVEMLQGTNQLCEDGEMFVDGIHLTDLGMMRWANLLEPVLRRMMKE